MTAPHVALTVTHSHSRLWQPGRTSPFSIHSRNRSLQLVRPSVSVRLSVRRTSGSGSVDNGFYRAVHFSAKRGIAIACRLSVRPSVRPSVCDVGEL